MLGVLRTLRGENVKEDTEELAYMARFPPKYNLPTELVNTLRSMPFWYTIQTHEDGEQRMARLRALCQYRRDLWVELLPTICMGQPQWIEGLNPPQRVLVDEDFLEDISTTLADVTVSELCILYRNRKISKEALRNHWKQALKDSTGAQLKMDLILLLRTNEIKVSQLNGQQRACLKEIGERWSLSPRLLNVFIRDKVVSKSEVLSQPGRLESLFDRMSPLNASRFVKNGVISRKDITPVRLKKLVSRIESSNDENALINAGLMTLEDIEATRQILAKNTQVRDESSSEMVDELIEYATLSDEQRALLAIEEEMCDPKNQAPGSGYHGLLVQQLRDAMGWPEAERTALANQAAAFFQKNGSKKKSKEYKSIILQLQGD